MNVNTNNATQKAETTYGSLAGGYVYPRPTFPTGTLVHVRGFTSPTSTGTVEAIEQDGNEATFSYLVDFHDGEVSTFAEDELEEASPAHRSARAAYDTNPSAFYGDEAGINTYFLCSLHTTVTVECRGDGYWCPVCQGYPVGITDYDTLYPYPEEEGTHETS